MLKRKDVWLLLLIICSTALASSQEDILVFAPSETTWFVSHSSPNPDYLTGVADNGERIGNASDMVLTGDVNGDGLDDLINVSVVDGTANWSAGHTWSFFGDGILETGGSSMVWGPATDIQGLFSGDVNGDGYDDVILVNAGGAGGIYFYAGHSDANGLGLDSTVVSTVILGSTTLNDIPLAADFNGDGYTDICIYRAGTWYPRASDASGIGASVIAAGVGFGGVANDVPLAGDMDGDGRDDYVIYRDGTWFCRQSNADGSLSGNPIAIIATFGTVGDVPLLADIDGDGKDDQLLFRAGMWYAQFSSGGSATVGFGAADAIPLTGQFDVPAVQGDLDNDTDVDLADFAIMAENWLVDCNVDPGDPACNIQITY